MWFALALSACSRRAPSATAGGVRLLDVGWDEVTAEVTVILDNPAWIDIPVTSFDWALSVGDRVVAHGARDDLAPLAADSKTSITVPVTVSWPDLFSADTGWTTWAFAASATLDTPAGPLSLPVSRSGAFPSLAPPSFDGLGFGREGGEILVDLTVDTPQIPGFSVDSLAWTLDLTSHRVGAGSLAPGPVPEGAARRSLLLRTRADVANAGAAVLASWRQGAVSVVLAYEGQLMTPLGAVPLRGAPRWSVAR